MKAVSCLSPAEREAVARQDAPFLAAGLVLGNQHSFEAHVRQAARLIGNHQTSASPNARLVRHVCELFERSVPESARAQLACAGGCAFCCYQPVRVSPPEAFFVARLIAERPETVAAVREAAAKPGGRRTDTPGGFWLKCPLLDQGSTCSVYAVRPLACHSYVSLNVNDCKTAYHRPGSEIVREPFPYRDLKNSCRMVLQASLRVNGLPSTHYELNAVLCAVLDTDNAEKRWLRGENIFGQLPELDPNPPEIEALLVLIADR